MIAQKVSIKINAIIAGLVALVTYIIMCLVLKTLIPDIPVLIYTFVIAFLANLLIDVVRNYNVLLDKYNALTTDYERLLNDYNEQKKVVGAMDYNLRTLIKQKKDAQRVYHHSKEEMDEMTAKAEEERKANEDKMPDDVMSDEVQDVDFEEVKDIPTVDEAETSELDK